MNGQQPEGGDRSLAAELRLRPDRPRVTRISRKVLIGLGTVASVSILGLEHNRTILSRAGDSGAG